MPLRSEFLDVRNRTTDVTGPEPTAPLSQLSVGLFRYTALEESDASISFFDTKTCQYYDESDTEYWGWQFRTAQLLSIFVPVIAALGCFLVGVELIDYFSVESWQMKVLYGVRCGAWFTACFFQMLCFIAFKERNVW